MFLFRKVNLHQIMDPDNQVLIEGVLFRARYLGSTQLVTDGNPTKLTRMLQAQEAVGRIKASVFRFYDLNRVFGLFCQIKSKEKLRKFE